MDAQCSFRLMQYSVTFINGSSSRAKNRRLLRVKRWWNVKKKDGLNVRLKGADAAGVYQGNQSLQWKRPQRDTPIAGEQQTVFLGLIWRCLPGFSMRHQPDVTQTLREPESISIRLLRLDRNSSRGWCNATRTATVEKYVFLFELCQVVQTCTFCWVTKR